MTREKSREYKTYYWSWNLDNCQVGHSMCMFVYVCQGWMQECVCVCFEEVCVGERRKITLEMEKVGGRGKAVRVRGCSVRNVGCVKENTIVGTRDRQEGWYMWERGTVV